jgi:hypothetical protein
LYCASCLTVVAPSLLRVLEESTRRETTIVVYCTAVESNVRLFSSRGIRGIE